MGRGDGCLDRRHIPIAALFVFFQRYFIKGLTAAAVKG